MSSKAVEAYEPHSKRPQELVSIEDPEFDALEASLNNWCAEKFAGANLKQTIYLDDHSLCDLLALVHRWLRRFDRAAAGRIPHGG